MPGNVITINDGAEFYLGDSNMPKLIDVLNKRGVAQNRAAKSLIKEATKTFTNKQNMQLPTECPDPNCGAPIKVVVHHSAQCRYCR